MTREEFYKLTDILNSEVLGNFMHGGEADELIAMFEEAVEHSNILEQEEPVSDDFTKALAECIHQAQCSVVDPLAHAEIWKEELVKLVKCEEPVSEDLLSKVDKQAKCIWDEINTGHEYSIIDSYNQFYGICMQIAESIKEEPLSEELEEASKEWLRPQLDKSYSNYGEAKMMELTHFDGYAMLDAIEFGAKWQKEKDKSITDDEDGEFKTIEEALAYVEQLKKRYLNYE